MADFLLELLSEEIPARMQAGARNELARLFAECTEAAGLATGAIDVFSTPRRLALIARDVAEATEATREEIKGPRTSAPQQALDGFLRKTGLKHEQLEEREGVWFAVVERPGLSAAQILAGAVQRIITDFHWPKSMRWGSGDLRWVRPLHGIVAMLGEEIVPVEVAGIISGATTVGHRFHHPGPITLGGAADYVEKMRACHVIVDQEERQQTIRDGATAAAEQAGLSLLEDEGLVVENAGLTSWPVSLLGQFDEDFLDVPREVIVLTMRTNQKYFACTASDGGLAPAFVCVANVAAEDGGAAIVEGNRRVLAARLADARFFWEQDLKVPLESQAKKLDGIVFHEKLGTVADKVERVAKLARWLVEEGIVTSSPRHPRESGNPAASNGSETRASAGVTKEELADLAERAARLAKADLVTGMVGEFPELQGVIGGYLAEAQGEPSAVADAIRDHYKPAGQGDQVPTAPVSVAVALADKLDTLFAFFRAGMLPTGSKDPFALRRAAIGSISLILDNGLRIHTDAPAEFWLGRSDDRRELTDAEISHRSILTAVPDFLLDRLQVQQRDKGIRHDLIAASARWGFRDDGRLDRIVARAAALQKLVETSEGADLLTAYKRAANILKKEKWEGTRATGGGELEAQERALVEALEAAEPQASAAVEREDFTGAMAALATLRKPIDDFFDHVTVNDPDQAKRERRLNLLMRFRDAVNRVADFSKIEG
ncbi:MAG TPA: glycine--tRNA ligase subunit beta [Sphingomicrobium sp.]|nr:glycine--tRNA ligase subunit beta [Sphingomicrobium sp.]